MATLSFKNIKKVYDGNVDAVIDFNLEIEDKEFMVFVGPSGCGKSTTLRMVAGLEDITEGELYIDNRKVNDVAPKDRDIAMVFQSYALYPHMTVFNNMAFGLKIRKMPKDEIRTKVTETAKILGLLDLLDRKPKQLSGGQRQRVALGRAIVRNPKVFLMDEPLSNLDAKLRVQTRAEIIRLHKQIETTTIYVTHDQVEAMTMANRIVVMNEARIQQVGKAKEIYDNPNNIFVGGFIGTPSMNFIRGNVDKEGKFTSEGITLKVPDQKLQLLKEKSYIDKPVVLGIRPEDVYDDEANIAKYEGCTLNCTVSVAELLGSETNIFARVGNQDITANVPARADLTLGDPITLAFNLNKCHFFDKETEERIR